MGGGVSGGGSGGTRSTVKIVVNILISFIGAGVLGMPYAFRQAGVAEGVIIMTLVAVFAVYAMLLIIDCKDIILRDKLNTPDRVPLIKSDSANGSVYDKQIETNLTYSDVGFYASGKVGKVLVDVSLLISQIGFCCAYLIFISENLHSYFSNISRLTWLCLMLPLLFLLTLIRHLHKLSFFSIFAQISSSLAFMVVFWFDFRNIHYYKKRFHPREWSFEGFPFFLAVAVYCYEGAGMVLALESSVAQEARHKFRKLFIGTLVLVTGLYIAFGALGYLSFGNATNPIITLNLSPSSTGFNFAMLVKLCLSVSLFFTYPVMMFPVTQLLENNFCPRNKKGEEQYIPIQNLLRFGLVVSTGAIVMFIPSFADIMALVGSTCCTLLAFVLPATFHLSLQKKASKWSILIDYWLILMGLFGAVMGTMDTLNRLSSNRNIVAQATDYNPVKVNGTLDAAQFFDEKNTTLATNITKNLLLTSEGRSIRVP